MLKKTTNMRWFYLLYRHMDNEAEYKSFRFFYQTVKDVPSIDQRILVQCTVTIVYFITGNDLRFADKQRVYIGRGDINKSLLIRI